MVLAGLTPNLHAQDRAQDRVLLDYNMKTPPPADWPVEGYAFGEHGLFYSPRMIKPGNDKSISIEVTAGNATLSKCRVHELKSSWPQE